MFSENYQYIRDFLYLFALLSGIGTGFVFRSIKKDISERSKSSGITIALCAFSGAIAMLSPALVLSRGELVFDRGLIIVATAIILLSGSAVLYPRYCAFPLTIFSGVIIVLLGFLFFKYPEYQNSPVTIAKITIQEHVGIRAGAIQTRNSFSKTKMLHIDPVNAHLNYSIAALKLNRVIPIIGGYIYIIPMSLYIEEGNGYRFAFFSPKYRKRFFITHYHPFLFSGWFCLFCAACFGTAILRHSATARYMF